MMLVQRASSPTDAMHRAALPFGFLIRSEMMLAHLGFWGDDGLSRDQGGDEGSEKSFSASAGVVDELEEAETEGQLLLRDAAARA